MRRIFTKKIGEQKRESKPVKQANETGDEKRGVSSGFFSYGDQGNIDDRNGNHEFYHRDKPVTLNGVSKEASY